MRLCVVLRSYGGGNDKPRPPCFSKELVLASFVRAAHAARAAGVDLRVVYANDGPIPEARMRVMEATGQILTTTNGPVGLLGSYRFALDIPDLLRLGDDDVIAYFEDDYLMTADAFTVLADGASQLRAHGVEYFAVSGSRPDDLADPGQRRLHGVPRVWQPRPDLEASGRRWIHILSATSTFAARAGALRADRDIHELAMKPFRRRFLDHEMCLVYQGIRPYYGTELFFGLAGDFVPGLRGIARAAWLLPYRFQINARARKQTRPHYLYAVQPPVATHMEIGMMSAAHDWEAEAASVTEWAASHPETGPLGLGR